jgi:L-fuconolactonase
MTPTLDRRQFLSLAAAGAAALASAEASAAPPPIVDCHQHLWDFRRFRPPWLKSAGVLNRSYTMEDYLRATRGLNVVKAVYMEVDVAPEQQQEEADYITRICERGRTPTVAAVVSGRPGHPGFAPYARQFQGSAYIKGLRQVLHVPERPRGYCLRPAFVDHIQLLGELGLTFDLCMRAVELPDAAKLIDLCPRTRFILDHCGRADAHFTDAQLRQWKRDLADVAKRRNVICKVSGIIQTCRPRENKARALEPLITHTLKAFGPNRVIFASDWPVTNLSASFEEWVEAVRWAVRHRTAAEQRRLFHDNAVRFYGL